MTTDIATRTVRANGLNFTYLEAGQGPLVICIHGFPDTPLSFTDVIRRLAADGYRVVAPYTRGISPTEAPADDNYQIATLGNDILSLITALGAERATLIGHDWGAISAYAAVGLDPSRVDKLVTIAIPPPRAIRPTPVWLAMVTFFQLTPVATFGLRYQQGALVDRIYHAASPRWSFGPQETAAFKAVLEAPEGARGALGTYRSFFRQLIRGGGSEESRRFLLRKISVPTMNVLGTNDPTTRPETLARIPDAFDGPFEVVTLQGTGHFPHRERPEEFAKHLQRFLGRPGVSEALREG